MREGHTLIQVSKETRDKLAELKKTEQYTFDIVITELLEKKKPSLVERFDFK